MINNLYIVQPYNEMYYYLKITFSRIFNDREMLEICLVKKYTNGLLSDFLWVMGIQILKFLFQKKKFLFLFCIVQSYYNKLFFFFFYTLAVQNYVKAFLLNTKYKVNVSGDLKIIYNVNSVIYLCFACYLHIILSILKFFYIQKT